LIPFSGLGIEEVFSCFQMTRDKDGGGATYGSSQIGHLTGTFAIKYNRALRSQGWSVTSTEVKKRRQPMLETTNRKNEDSSDEKDEKASVTLAGTVEKIIPSPDPDASEKAQIAVEGAEDLYREIRVDNTLKDATGEEVSLKLGSEVDVTIEADKEAVQKKKN